MRPVIYLLLEKATLLVHCSSPVFQLSDLVPSISSVLKCVMKCKDWQLNYNYIHYCPIRPTPSTRFMQQKLRHPVLPSWCCESSFKLHLYCTSLSLIFQNCQKSLDHRQTSTWTTQRCNKGIAKTSSEYRQQLSIPDTASETGRHWWGHCEEEQGGEALIVSLFNFNNDTQKRG